MNLEGVYANRFNDRDWAVKSAMWREITAYLQRFIPADARVIDIACDRGYFIRHVRAAERWATDLRPIGPDLPEAVHFVQGDGLRLDQLVPLDHFDVAFMSNYLEHLPSGDAVVQQMQVVARILRRNGSVIVLQPNYRLVGAAYWDFIDHRVALTDRSLEEAAQLAGFATRRMVKRFLPFSTKSRLPQHPALVRAYLAFPPAWLVLGRQTLYVGRLA